jgi:putative endonuclease
MLSDAKHLVGHYGLKMRTFFVYIMTNRSGTLYTGVTNDLARRAAEHKAGEIKGFTSKYRIDRLVYVEPIPTARAAILREKQIKGWVRRRKIALVDSANPTRTDLGDSLVLIR